MKDLPKFRRCLYHYESVSECHFPSTYQISCNSNTVTPMALINTPLWFCVVIYGAPTALGRHVLSVLHHAELGNRPSYVWQSILAS